jgi:hypothetical protein
MRRILIAMMSIGMAAALPACTAEVEDPGSVPDVDVEGGELPDVDIDPAEVEITTDTQTVRVPEVEVRP